MKTGSTTGITPGASVPAKRRAPRTKANGRDHSAVPLNGAGTSAGPGGSPQDQPAASTQSAEDLAKAAEATGSGGISIRAGDYAIRNGCLVGFKTVKGGGEVPYRLCTFTARITHQMPAEAGILYRIEATLQDRTRHTFILPAAEFTNNPRRWVPERLGARASIMIGHHEKMILAIQAISEAIGIIQQTAAVATGYAAQKGSPVFIMPNRVIALPGVDTSDMVLHLPDELQHYSLAEPPTAAAAVDALEAAARLPAIGDLAVMLPLWLQAFRAVLPFVPPPGYAIWLHGLTGTLKSSVSAVVLNLFGREWGYQQMPGTFLDTRATLEVLMYLTRNLLSVLDDGVSDGSRRGKETVTGVLADVLRMVGNLTGRGRRGQYMIAQLKRKPRGAVIINAEGLPPGGSAAARAYTVHIKSGDIDKIKLSQAQQDGSNGVLEAAMAVFIQAMLAEDRDSFVAKFEADRKKYRAQAEALQGKGAHGRTADAIGELMATAEVVFEVFDKHGVTLPFDLPEALTVLIGGGEAHTATVAHSQPVLMWRRTLRELIERGNRLIADQTTGQRPKANASAWGWTLKALDTLRTRDGAVIGYADIDGLHDAGLDVEEVYLRRDETYAVVLEALRQAGEVLPLDLNSMWAALVDQGLAIPNAKTGDLTHRVQIRGARQRFVKCRVAILSEEDSDATGEAREVEEVPDPDEP